LKELIAQISGSDDDGDGVVREWNERWVSGGAEALLLGWGSFDCAAESLDAALTVAADGQCQCQCHRPAIHSTSVIVL